jgi:hypothetical protein
VSSKCIHCGDLFTESWWGKNPYRGRKKYYFCSKDCATKRKEELLKRRTECVVCHGPKDSRHSLTCSPECKKIRHSATAKLKVPNRCLYTAPNDFDYSNMLDILHRKGYVKANDIKEKHTYTTDGVRVVEWIDRMASDVVVARSPSSGKEQQRHEDGVQQQA